MTKLRASHSRLLVKAISYRLLGTATTAGISYAITGSVEKAFVISSIEVISKIVLFYLHERLWERI
jgi:uncharacterized membrane protein